MLVVSISVHFKVTFLFTYPSAVPDGVDLLEDTPLDVPFRRVGAVPVRLRQTNDVELQTEIHINTTTYIISA